MRHKHNFWFLTLTTSKTSTFLITAKTLMRICSSYLIIQNISSDQTNIYIKNVYYCSKAFYVCFEPRRETSESGKSITALRFITCVTSPRYLSVFSDIRGSAQCLRLPLFYLLSTFGYM